MSERTPNLVTLGVNAFTPNSSASLLVDDQYVGSAEEERFSGPKRAATWPTRAIEFLLGAADVESTAVRTIAFNFDPTMYTSAVHDTRFAQHDVERRLIAFEAARERLSKRLMFASQLYPSANVIGVSHHRAHAAYAVAASPLPASAVLILDSVGETVASTIWRSRKLDQPIWTAPDYSSVGFFYAAVTAHLGWRPNDEEGTVMALAALGDPSRFRSIMRRVISYHDRRLAIDPSLLPARVRRVRQPFTAQFCESVCPPRAPGEAIDPVHVDLAAAAQERLQEVVAQLVKLALELTGEQNIVISGGVAENCVTNGMLAAMPEVKGMYVPPAPGDAGTSLGSALIEHAPFGSMTSSTIANPLVGGPFDIARLDPRFIMLHSDMSVGEAARQLLSWCDSGQVVGLIRGRFEYGPRALGNRSIIASPLQPGVGEKLNRMVKRRESFRPFAPVVRAESAGNIFDLPAADIDLSTMSLALPVRADFKHLHEIVHANGLARVQTVTQSRNPVLWEALRIMEDRGDPGILINTSLNVKGQPICGTAELLYEFAKQSSVRMYLIDENAYKFTEDLL